MRGYWLHEPQGEGTLWARKLRADPELRERGGGAALLGEPRLRPITWIGAEPSACGCPNLRPSTTSISLRLPVSLLERIKIAAHKRDVPYQSLIKTWLAEKLDAGSMAPAEDAAQAAMRRR